LGEAPSDGGKGEWGSGLPSLDYFSFLGGRFPTTNERPRMASLKEDDRHAGKEKEGDVA
jgi:hypothetical protein